jgi:HAE1 family hydrophobic/amphiphilic exporter-1
MFLSNASIRRPIAMLCLIIGLSLLGLNAYRKMGLEILPAMDFPLITIVTVYPGASPEELEVDVAKRIEDKVVTLEGLHHVTSTCSENVVLTFLQFKIGVDVDVAAVDVREKIGMIRNDFPDAVHEPQILKYDSNAKPVMIMALTGDAPLDEMFDFADNELSDAITVIQGVAETQVIGGAEREVHVLLDREKLAARGLSSMNAVQALGAGMGTIPSGRLRHGGDEYNVKFDADFDRIHDIGGLEIASDKGQRSYLRDFASVEMSTKELRQKATLDGKPVIAIKVVKKPDANAVQVIRDVRAAMARLEGSLPGGMQLVWVSDDEVYTKALVDSAWTNVAQGVLLTALVLFLFLYNFRTTLIVSITMPLTIVIGLFFIQAMGFSLNSSTLIAIGMSVGILVTNSIVVIEAVIKWLERSGRVRYASRMGAGEAAIAVIASAATNLVVLFPIAMMSNMIGIFIKPLVLTMIIMTGVSLFISFTLTPILCSILLKPAPPESRSLLSRMERAWNWMFDRVVGVYIAFLSLCERRRPVAVAFLALIVFGFFLVMGLGKNLGMGFFPESDKAEILVKVEFPTRYNIDMTEERLAEVQKRLEKIPEVQHALTTIGKVEGVVGQNTEGVYLAQILLILPAKTKRDRAVFEIVEGARNMLKGIPDCIITVSAPNLSGGSAAGLEMEIYGSDLKELDTLALQSRQLAMKVPGLDDVDTTVRAGKPELRVRPNRAVLADLNTPAAGVGMALRGNLEGITAGTFKQGDRNYDIVVKFDPIKGKRQVQDFQFPGAPGHATLLSSIGQIEESVAPVQIIRKDKQRISKLTANLAAHAALGDVANQLSAELDNSKIIPLGYKYNYGAAYEFMNEGQRDLGEAGLIAIVLIFLTLAAIMESFTQPLLILLTTIPFALMGVVGALFLSGYSFSIFVTMGIVMLFGIVVNNAILILDQFNINVKNTMPRRQAMIAACRERFRPVIMITLAAVLGMLPLAFGTGIGCEFRNDIGMASVGGIAVSGVLTLFVLPVLYILFTRRDSAAAPADQVQNPGSGNPAGLETEKPSHE